MASARMPGSGQLVRGRSRRRDECRNGRRLRAVALHACAGVPAALRGAAQLVTQEKQSSWMNPVESSSASAGLRDGKRALLVLVPYLIIKYITVQPSWLDIPEPCRRGVGRKGRARSGSRGAAAPRHAGTSGAQGTPGQQESGPLSRYGRHASASRGQEWTMEVR